MKEIEFGWACRAILNLMDYIGAIVDIEKG